MIRATILGMSLIALAPATGLAAACTQGRAIYMDADRLYTLAFSPVQSDAAATSHAFTITVDKTGHRMDGHVMASDPLGRPVGTLLDQCPDGDVTGEDLAACTIWEGLLYSHSDGEIDILPAESEPAAGQILLPGFGDALVHSKAWAPGKATVAPWDVFTLKGCAS